ncbi:hypothetical protein Mgra_00009558 [Meloidogyne graminicola]|uniref:KCTD8/12/16 H1 domain-containing protein n=1 Tax=Meloidogyne graminicola TaxID=189291 RepID=A0A8S9ZBI8_9BILA|nr:hypothetical protein Mgra_00009558 [Meloidogyne graminicola]
MNSQKRIITNVSNSPQKQRVIRCRLSNGRNIECFAEVLQREANSRLAEWANKQNFVDCSHRDPKIFRYLINCLRQCVTPGGISNGKQFVPPEEFTDWRFLLSEARYWRLTTVEKIIREAMNSSSTSVSTITIGYHGTLAAGRGGFEVNFRRVDRIMVCGKARACREVFGRFLNETRDWNMDSQRYTSRFYLTHQFVEQAFDALAAKCYRLISSNCSGPSLTHTKSVVEDEQPNFAHYRQHVFIRYI